MSDASLPPPSQSPAPSLHQPGLPVLEPHPGPSVRGDRLLVKGDQLAARVDALLRRALSADTNPLLQTGTMAIALLLLAVVSGILILIWYSPSVTQAYDSLGSLGGHSLGGWMRSLHRYSSDACLIYVLLHASRMFFARKITESRWLAWVSGVLLLGLLWFVGWTGYWLVWDERAQLVALASIKIMDTVPIFGGPLARLFVSDSTVPSLLFFIVFFLHIFLPLAMAGGLAIHLARLSRARILPTRRLTVWVFTAVGLAALIFPAVNALPARMQVEPGQFGMDWWYLWPLALTQRLSGPALVALFAGAGLVLIGMPWWMHRRRPRAAYQVSVDVARCHACTLCVQDCPFDAIAMVPRTDGKRFPSEAQVNPDRCVGCGVCVGACDADSIELPWINTQVESQAVEQAVLAAAARGDQPLLALICAEAGGGDWGNFNREAWRHLLPDYHVWPVPCVGWVQPKLLERMIAKGAAGMLVISCGEGELRCREGGKFFQARLDGTRQPSLRTSRANPGNFLHLTHDVSDPDRTRLPAAEFARTVQRPASPVRSRLRALGVALSLSVAFIALVTAVANAPFRNPAPVEPEFVFSMKAQGDWINLAGGDAGSQADKPVHMRSTSGGRRTRAPVRVRLTAAGKTHEHTVRPLGLSRDGASFGEWRLILPEGMAAVRIEIFTAPGATLPQHHWEGTLAMAARRKTVLTFDPSAGFAVEP